MSREPRRKQLPEVDVSRFKSLVDEALRAFGSDVRYSVEMSRAAVTVERKRKVCKERSKEHKEE